MTPQLLSHEDKSSTIFDEILVIHEASFSAKERAPRGILYDVFLKSDVFVILNGTGHVIAFSFLSVKFGNPYVWIIATAESSRGEGHAGWLLSYMESHLRNFPSPVTEGGVIWLTVHQENIAAQRLYLSHGYRVTNYLRAYYGSGDDGLEMTKSLVL
jgi:ribosomal protein S18 acetylase RimI-like enzyme